MAHDGVTRKRTALGEAIRRLGTAPKHVVIGVTGSAAAAPHKGEDGGTASDGPTVAQVAIWNHVGTSTIPARPFISIAFAKYGEEIKSTRDRIIALIIRGRLEMDQGLELLGLEAVARVKQTIIEHVPPPNADSTINGFKDASGRVIFPGKNSSTPLVDTGQLIGSIQYQVREGR